MKKTTTRWWENIEAVDKPMPHIPEKQILAVMPEDIKPMWENWICGQTCLLCDDMDSGIYKWDWERFVGKLERNEKLVDTAAEWD